jgi:hypothetical protein
LGDARALSGRAAARGAGGALGGLAFLLALAGPRPLVVSAGLAGVLRTAAPWGTLALLTLGIIALTIVARRESTAGRRWPALLCYAVTLAGLAACWHWWGVVGAFDALPNARERAVIALVPHFIIVGALANVAVAFLLPAQSLARGDARGPRRAPHPARAADRARWSCAPVPRCRSRAG